MRYRLFVGDVLDGLASIPDQAARCVVTSPPYWGLRDYGVAGQMGLEATPALYIENMVAAFREVRRVLCKDGTLWLNMGDCYHSGARGNFMRPRVHRPGPNSRAGDFPRQPNRLPQEGLKDKDLIGMPWRLALALQADGWWLRSDIIWHKKAPMPESVRDRPTRSHEYVFLLSRSHRYFYDLEANMEPASTGSHPRASGWAQGPGLHDSTVHARPKMAGRNSRENVDRVVHPRKAEGARARKYNASFDSSTRRLVTKRRMRSVWSLGPAPNALLHFATFPEELVRRCVLAGSERGDVILDPFAGTATTGVVALALQRCFIGIELSPAYAEMARKRLAAVAPLFSEGSGA